MMSPQKSLKVAIALSVAVVALFMMSSMAAPMSSGIQANNFTASQGIQPYTTMNSNVTWSTFYNGWNTLEYNNGTTKGNLTLPAQISSIYQNPITVNPSDIIAKGSLQQEKIGSYGYWNTTSGLIMYSSQTNVTSTGRILTQNGVQILGNKATVTGTTKTGSEAVFFRVPTTDYLSTNPAYDYITIIGSTNISKGQAEDAFIAIGNTTQIHNFKSFQNGASYISISLEQIARQYKIGFNTTAGKGYSSYVQIMAGINIPAGATAGKYFSQIDAVAMTTEPLYLGTNSTGSQVTAGNGNIQLTSFAPNFQWTEITNNGYSVAVSQPLQKATIQQNALSGSNYIEQIEYQGSFGLPTAPDLTYGVTTLAEQFNISTSQVQVLDINGQSYLSSITGKNGTVVLISAATPTTSTSFLQIVDYTSSQWQSISGPPGFFSVAGIEYYFDELVLGIAAFLGLGATAAALKVRQLRRAR